VNPNPYQPGPYDRSAPSGNAGLQHHGSHEPSPFAVHGDPTHRAQGAKPESERKRRRVMWIRPTDLPTHLVGSRQMLAGIDLHAALVTKLWRAPAKAVEAVRRRSDRAEEPATPDTAPESNGGASQRPGQQGVSRS